MAIPNITIVNISRTKISRVSSPEQVDRTVLTLSVDTAINRYTFNRDGADHLTGTVVEAADLSVGANTQFQVTIDDDQRVLLEGNNTVNLYVRNTTGEWSDGLTEPSGYRYIRLDLWGAASEVNTSRCLEIEIYADGVNVLRSPVKIIGNTDDPINTVSGTPTGDATGQTVIDSLTDGVVTNTNYVIWWDAVPNGWIKFDLGAQKNIERVKIWWFSASGNQKAGRWKIQATNTLSNFGANGALIGTEGVDYKTLWDYSTNTTLIGINPNNFVEKSAPF